MAEEKRYDAVVSTALGMKFRIATDGSHFLRGEHPSSLRDPLARPDERPPLP